MIDTGTRKSGRTTRMIKEAMELADKGHAVYVLTANAKERCRIEGIIRGVTDTALIKVETWQSLRRSVDERTLTLGLAHPNCRLVIDHYAIEHRFAVQMNIWMQKMHKYDE